MYIPRRNKGWRHLGEKSGDQDGRDGTMIPCMYLPNNRQASKLMIYFHGIGEDVYRILSEPYQIRKKLGYNILCVEYPGYGINFHRGVCSEQQMIYDSYSVLDFVLSVTTLKP